MNFKKLLVQSLLWRSLYFTSVLLVNIFLSRFLQASAVGKLYYLTSIFWLMQLLVSLSLESGITFFASGKIIKFNKLLWLSVAWSFVIGLTVLIITFLYLYAIKHSQPEKIIQYCFFVVCYVTGMLLVNYCSVLFYAQDNFFLPNAILVLINFVFAFSIPFNNHAGSATINAVLYRYFLVFFIQGLVLVIAFIIKNKSWRQLLFPSGNELKKLTRFSLTALMANFIFFLVYRIDYWFVHANTAICTQADLGNYIQVSKMGQVLLIVPQIIASVIFPKTASGSDRAELNTSLMVIARLLSQLFLCIILVMALFGNQLFIFLFGETFNRMFWPFIIILPGIFCLSVLSLLSAYFSGKGNLKVTVLGACIALLVVIVGDYIFVPLYGIIAAAAVSTAGYFVNMLYSLLQFYKDYSVSWADFFKWSKRDYAWLKSLLTRK